MSTNLWSANTPASFWLLEPEADGRPAASPEEWQTAIGRSAYILGLPLLAQEAGREPVDVDDILLQTLGEGQFGPRRWHLSPAKRAYYALKPLLPRAFTRALRRATSRSMHTKSQLGWPVEDRYARFQWEVVRQLLLTTRRASLSFRYFWPQGRAFALVLTHDVETAGGQAYVRDIADLEERLGFRSSFNFVPERYTVDTALLAELRGRGFEVGVHGLKHDGKLFGSRAEWSRRAVRINSWLQRLGARGFRTPLTHRQPEWMQDLEIDYDLSFFDTDPYEPMPGGTMSVWPFQIGHFVELPYTLVQDYTLTSVLGESTPQLWLEKVDFLRRYHGMVLLNSHPDYLLEDRTRGVYIHFLESIKERGGYWHALPGDVARWWRDRRTSHPLQGEGDASALHSEYPPPGSERGEIRLESGVLVVGPRAGHQVRSQKQPAEAQGRGMPA